MKRARPVLLVLSICLVAWAAGCGKSEPTEPDVPLEASHVDGERALYEVHRLVALGARDGGTPGCGARGPASEEAPAGTGGGRPHRHLYQPDSAGRARVPQRDRPHPGTPARPDSSGLAFRYQVRHRSGFSGGQRFPVPARGCCWNWPGCWPRAWHGSPGPEIHLLFFDGEEAVQHYSEVDGLHGSRHHAQRMVEEGRDKDVLAMILLDMMATAT